MFHNTTPDLQDQDHSVQDQDQDHHMQEHDHFFRSQADLVLRPMASGHITAITDAVINWFNVMQSQMQ